MTWILTSDIFLTVGTALISLGMGIFVKIVSRNDRHQSFKPDDFAVGMDLLIGGIIILITRSTKNFSGGDADRLWAFFLIFGLLWITSTVVRKWGWKGENQLNVPWGVIFPDVVGSIAIVGVVYNT